MLELVHVTKTYPTPSGPHVVLDDISAEFRTGESVGILGRNGAGKSTLLRLLAGAELPDLGRVVRFGRVSWPLGFAGGFSGSLTGLENCRFVARIHDADVDQVVDEAREFADIGKFFFLPVRTYSSGMRARLAFGLSMAIDFEVYLVDEVTAVGDKRFQEKCRLAFAERRGRASVIMVSHSMDTLKQYCTRCAVLHDRKLVMYDTLDAARAAYEAVA